MGVRQATTRVHEEFAHSVLKEVSKEVTRSEVVPSDRKMGQMLAGFVVKGAP